LSPPNNRLFRLAKLADACRPARGLKAMVLKQQCGDYLTRENIMNQAASLKNFHSE
jgi:hypothetical protein